MAREKLRQPAGLLDHSAVEHDAFARLSVRGLVPHQHQAVLQQRQFVFTSTHRRDQTRRQSLVDEAVIHLRRAADRAHQRVVIHAWNEILGWLMVSARPSNRAHSPRNSERIVTTTCTSAALAAGSASTLLAARPTSSTNSSASSRLVSFS